MVLCYNRTINSMPCDNSICCLFLSKLIQFRHQLEHLPNPIQKRLQQTWVYFCTVFQPFAVHVYGYTPFSMLLLLKLMTTGTPPLCVTASSGTNLSSSSWVSVRWSRAGSRGCWTCVPGRSELSPSRPTSRTATREPVSPLAGYCAIGNVQASLIFDVFEHRRLLEFKHIAMLCVHVVNEITFHKELRN